MSKKKPGTERPYTFSEFLSIVEKLAAGNGVEFIEQLDYFLASEREAKIVRDDCTITSVTRYGGSEGIYSGFTIKQGGEEQRLFTAKTLWESDEAFVKMHVFAANIVLIADRYIKEHGEEFNWSGYDVGYTNDKGAMVPYFWCATKEQATARAAEVKEKGLAAYIRDNETRKCFAL